MRAHATVFSPPPPRLGKAVFALALCGALVTGCSASGADEGGEKPPVPKIISFSVSSGTDAAVVLDLESGRELSAVIPVRWDASALTVSVDVSPV
ncbi:MAG: hypothetical protein LBC77_08815, partial [Spirochaetaceae bacterium]|nr:hypothetical protein [Spirochaetaceae bacterium]